MAESQHLDEITVPDIEITAGWAVSEIETVEDCDDAYAYLMSAVAEIEYELELKDMGVCRFPDPLWPARARRAMKYKRAALQIVGYKRGRIMEKVRQDGQANRDRALIDHIKAVAGPALFHQWTVSFNAASVEEAA
jgi:hypothetical protein